MSEPDQKNSEVVEPNSACFDVRAVYTTATLEILRAMLATRDASHYLTKEEHADLVRLTTSVRHLTALHSHGNRSATEAAVTHLHQHLKSVVDCASAVENLRRQVEKHLQQSKAAMGVLPREVLGVCFTPPYQEDEFASDVHPRPAFDLWCDEYVVLSRRTQTQIESLKNTLKRLFVDFVGTNVSEVTTPIPHIDSSSKTPVSTEMQADCLEAVLPQDPDQSPKDVNPFISSFVFICHNLAEGDVSLPRDLVDRLDNLQSVVSRISSLRQQATNGLKGVENRLRVLDRCLSSSTVVSTARLRADRIFEEELNSVLQSEDGAWIIDDDSADELFGGIRPVMASVPCTRFRTAIAKNSQVANRIETIRRTMLPSANKAIKEEALKLSAKVRAVRRLAKQGDISSSSRVFSSIPDGLDISYEELEDVICRERETLEELRAKFAVCKRKHDELQHVLAASKRGAFHWLTGGDDSGEYRELESALTLAAAAVRKLKWRHDSEYMDKVRGFIAKATPWMESCGLVLRWVPTGESLSQAVKRVPTPNWPPAIAALYAMCAVGAADGDFCAIEKQTVVRAAKLFDIGDLKEPGLSVPDGIKQWQKCARKEGVSQMVAMSTRGLRACRKSADKERLMEALESIANADGIRDKRENEILLLMSRELGLEA